MQKSDKDFIEKENNKPIWLMNTGEKLNTKHKESNLSTYKKNMRYILRILEWFIIFKKSMKFTILTETNKRRFICWFQ